MRTHQTFLGSYGFFRTIEARADRALTVPADQGQPVPVQGLIVLPGASLLERDFALQRVGLVETGLGGIVEGADDLPAPDIAERVPEIGRLRRPPAPVWGLCQPGGGPQGRRSALGGEDIARGP